jgi:zinc D-Ala-D-Ala carboxypeptidase
VGTAKVAVGGADGLAIDLWGKVRPVDGLAGIAARITEIQSHIATITVLGSAKATAGSTAASAASSSTSATSFASALADAVSQTDPAAQTGVTPAAVGGGKLNADGVPADLARYGNGRIPAGALRTISGTRHRLWAPAATSFDALQQAARRDGVHIGITDSYRSYAEQVDLVRRKGLYSQGGLAAKPGTSNHGWGRALDLSLDGKAQAWMRANAVRFGFVEDVPREPWHWDYKPKK